LTPQGRIVAHMHIIADAEAIWLFLERAAIPNLLAAFDRLLIMEDVQVADVSEGYSILAVMGPKAPGVLQAWAGSELGLTERYSHRRLENGRIVLSDLGYDLWVARGDADNVLRSLSNGGATAIDRGTWDVLRTEAGIPIYGVDIDDTTTMPEIGDRGISYEKGCYIGQEVVAKVKYIGHVNRKFVGLIVSGDAAPDLQSPIRKEGREVGRVTTALVSPALHHPIALGFVSRVASAPGSEVEVGSGTAQVVELPFKKPLSDY
jgi:folate-binding protein YgfZ